MIDVSQCPVCRNVGFAEVFANEFFGTSAEAAQYFLTDRQKAVHGRIVRCNACGFVLTSPQFTAAEYEQIYRHVASVEKPAGRSRATAARYGKLANLVRSFVSAGRFFDFGCGGGEFLDRMRGYEGVGLELRSGEVPAQYSQDGRIILSSLNTAVRDEVLKPRSFDFVTAWDVVEHLPELDADIATLRSLIKPDGWFFCTVPNVASLAARLSGEKWNCYLLEHLWYFSPETLEAYFERQAFDCRKVRPFLFPADVATLASRIAQTYGLQLPVPGTLANWTISLPAGVIFGAFQTKN